MSAPFRQRLRDREPLLGTVITTRDPALAELVGARFDLAWIDLEHSTLDVADVPPLAIALRSAGCAALARIPGVSFDRLGAVLDAGVDGVVVPRVETAGEAREIVSRMRYPPAGTRGVAARRASGYGPPSASHTSAAACLVQIESRDAAATAASIANVDGVDGMVIGTADLAQDLGVQQDLGGPAMVTALTAVQAAAHESHTAFGVAAGAELASITRVLSGPPDLAILSADARILAQAIDAAAGAARTLLGRGCHS